MKPQFRPFALVAVLFGLFSSCNTDPFEGIDLHISPELLEYTAMLELVDASGNGVIPDGASIRFSGPEADQVYPIAATKDFEFEAGKLAIGIHPDALQGNSSVEVTAIVDAPGYLTARTLIRFGGLKQQLINVPLLRTDNLPNGVGYVTQSYGLVNNAMPDDFTFVLPASAFKDVPVSLNVVSGTQFLDANGAVINGTNVEARIAGFDTDSPESMANYPVGLIAPNAMTPSGTNQNISFTSAGFAAIDLFVNGQEVFGFSQPATISMGLDPTLTNPNTGGPLAAGDAIEVWSYDETLEVWSYEQTGLVSNGSNGLEMSFTTNHLSWWNVDFFGVNCSSASLTLSITGGPGNYVVKMVNAANPAQSYSTQTLYLFDGMNISIYNVPNFPVLIEVYATYGDAYSGSNPLFTSAPFNPCSGPINLSIGLPAANPWVNLDIEGYCDGISGLELRPSFYVYFRPSGTTTWLYLGWVSNGIGATDDLVQGQYYDFAVWYGGWIESTNNLVDQTNYTFSFELGSFCDDL